MKLLGSGEYGPPKAHGGPSWNGIELRRVLVFRQRLLSVALPGRPGVGPMTGLDRTNLRHMPRRRRSAAIPPVPTETALSSPLPDLPPEIWLKIFQFATFIPFETDLSVTAVEPGLFCTFDGYQSRAFEGVLPLRQNLATVSRYFYQIGAEVLYTTFQAKSGSKDGNMRLSRFDNLLVSRPELGRFVKRLSLRWSIEDEESNYRIIGCCPNVVIFSSYLGIYPIRGGRWWRYGLPNTIRSFDANVGGVPIQDVLTLLEKLPYLEILHLWGLEGYFPIRLSALRILSIYSGAYSPTTFILELPRLTALEINESELDRLTLPLEFWQQLEYFKLRTSSNPQFHPEYFHNVHSLSLLVDSDNVQHRLGYFPFHQLECLTLCTAFPPSDTRDWQQHIGPIMAFPLDAEAMPELKLFQLEWTYSRTYNHYCDLLGPASRSGFTQYFDSLVTGFEQRGVLFGETLSIGRTVRPGFRPFRNVLAVCKRHREVVDVELSPLISLSPKSGCVYEVCSHLSLATRLSFLP